MPPRLTAFRPAAAGRHGAPSTAPGTDTDHDGTVDERDRGSVALELAILVPTVILLVLVIVQAALWYFAKEAALDAAREGVDAGRAYQGGGCGVAQSRADDRARTVGGDLLRDLTIVADCTDPTQVRVEVRATSVSVLPGLTITINQHASAPVERWTTSP